MQVIESLMTENTNTDLGKLELVDDLVVFLYMSIKESEKDCEKVKSQKGQKWLLGNVQKRDAWKKDSF